MRNLHYRLTVSLCVHPTASVRSTVPGAIYNNSKDITVATSRPTALYFTAQPRTRGLVVCTGTGAIPASPQIVDLLNRPVCMGVVWKTS